LSRLSYSVAVISDLHGNLTALQAVMDVIDGLNVEAVYCLGDILGKGAFPSEVVDICRSRCQVSLMGNHEDFFLKDRSVEHYTWIRNRLSPEQQDWVASLPVYRDLYLSGRKIRFCHADSRNVHYRVYPRQDRELKLSLFRTLDPEDTPVDVFCYGDVHYAYIEYLDSRKILINSGSVGNPMDLPQASFVLLSGDRPGDTDQSRPGPLGIQFVRVPYDIEKEVALTLASDMPEKGREIYITELRTGTYGKRWSRHT